MNTSNTDSTYSAVDLMNTVNIREADEKLKEQEKNYESKSSGTEPFLNPWKKPEMMYLSAKKQLKPVPAGGS